MTKDDRLNARELLVGTTPGEWRVRTYREGALECIQGSPVEGEIYGACVTNPRGICKPASLEGRANATLIAAAPRLAREHIKLTDELAAAHARIAELEDTLTKGPKLKQVGPNIWAARIRPDADPSKPLTMEQEMIIHAALATRNNPDE